MSKKDNSFFVSNLDITGLSCEQEIVKGAMESLFYFSKREFGVKT